MCDVCTGRTGTAVLKGSSIILKSDSIEIEGVAFYCHVR